MGEADSRIGELLASGHRVFAAGRSWQLSIFRPVAYELDRLEWFARRGLESGRVGGIRLRGRGYVESCGRDGHEFYGINFSASSLSI